MGITIVGIIGMILVLIAYTLNQLGRLSDDNVVYDGLNFAGALLLFIYALAEGVWPFSILNAVWGAVAGYDLYRYYKSKQKPVAVKAEARAEEPAEEKPKEEKPEPPKEVPEEAELTERRP